MPCRRPSFPLCSARQRSRRAWANWPPRSPPPCRRSFTLVGLLKGSFVFVADLARALSKAGCSPRIEFMRVSSYGSGTTSSGIVSLMGDAPAG